MTSAQSIYLAGRRARDGNKRKRAPAYMNWEHRHYWLGGWNDRDHELAE
jgi:ribosome modulation factor